MYSNRVLLLFSVIACTLFSSCDKNTVNNYGPPDWQPPVLEWQSLPDAQVRGTVGLDVSVTDSSAITLVRLFVDGALRDSLTTTPYRFSLQTDSLTDGVHLCEARAWDEYGNLGISPILRVNVMNSIAQGPRLLWVPDSFATIQAAINAAADYDTIRVRDGTYYETLNLFGKGIWMESEHGPSRCIIDGQHAQNVIFSIASREYVTIRGFILRRGGGITVQFDDGCRFRFLNNIVIADSEDALLYARRTAGNIRNNLFVARYICLEIWSLQGDVYNNIFENASIAALWNTNYGWNPVVYAYNLFWHNQSDYYGFEPGTGDVHGDPLVDIAQGRLLPGSSAIDSGNPEIFDLDSTRSDIGPFGGPYAYSN